MGYHDKEKQMGCLDSYKENLYEDIIEEMKTYVQEYSVELLSGVESCQKLLVEFLEKLEVTNNREEAMQVVRWIVEQLNGLNNAYDGILIETDERESLCGFIFGALKEIGIEVQDDVTEEWREW